MIYNILIFYFIINFYEDQYLDLINFMLFLKTFPLPRH
ncbi:tail tube protein [Klebsiella phage vB_KpnM_VAC13]|nr:tail tube protein [Klebsiella phage vB_KpnM_VAC13]